MQSLLCLPANKEQPRYVIFGTGSAPKPPNETDGTHKGSAARKAALKSSSSKPSLVDLTQDGSDGDTLYISIYKAKVCRQMPRGSRSITDLYRENGSSYRSILFQASRYAKYEDWPIENRAPCYQHSCSK